MTEGIRIDSLDPAVKRCMPALFSSIRSDELPEKKGERDEILRAAGVSVSRYQSCLLPESGKLTADLKAGLSFGGFLVGIAGTMATLGFFRERTRSLLSPRVLVRGGLASLAASLLLAYPLIKSEKTGGVIAGGGFLGNAMAALGVGLSTRSRLNKQTLPYYFVFSGLGLLIGNLILQTQIVGPSYANKSTKERQIAGGSSVITGVGLALFGMGGYRFLPGSWLPAWPILIVSSLLLAASLPTFSYQLLSSEKKKEEGKENHSATVILGILTGIALAGVGVGLAIHPRIAANNLTDDLIILGGMIPGCIGGLFLLGTGDQVSKRREKWGTVLNPD